MQRCLQLARLGSGSVAPNPMVGAVLVHEQRIIGEGYHKIYGGPHAEVKCIQSVNTEDKPLISAATLYVSLEPCAHFGKTPPCTNLIIDQHIPKVVVGCRDPFPEVDGKGIDQLRAAGVEVITGVLEDECKELNKRFFTFHTLYRPYIILKWAQTINGKISAASTERLKISSELTNRVVHRWRSEEAAILVGKGTALCDNPMLTVRLTPGKNPVRIVIDKTLSLPPSLHLFDQSVKTIVFNTIKQEEGTSLSYQLIDDSTPIVHQVAAALYKLAIQSVIIEGGAQTLQAFIDAGLWDEARVITAGTLAVPEGLAAPCLNATFVYKEAVGQDIIHYYVP